MGTTTEEKGIFLSSEEKELAKFLDGLINLSDLIKKKFLGIFSIGKWMEKNDRAAWKAIIAWIDDCYLDGKLSDTTIAAIKDMKNYVIQNDIDGFNSYLSTFISQRVEFLNSDTAEERTILGALTTLSGLTDNITNKIVEKFKEKVAEAEKEDE